MAVRAEIAASIFDINFQARTAALASLAILAAILTIAPTAQAQTFTILHNFTGGTDGSEPLAGLSLDRAGNLYGTAAYGGHCLRGSDCGTVFKLQLKNSNWVFSTLYEFSGGPDGKNPSARVIVGPDGRLYGTTTYGGTSGNGTVFRLQPPATLCRTSACPWKETVLHSFAGGNDGANPAYGDLTFDQAGNIYGTAPYGGSHGCGVVYELSPSAGGWTESILYTSTCADGGSPFGGVIFDNAGNLYGTISGNGDASGDVYKLTRTESGWAESTLYSFPFPGGAYGGLIFDSAGNLYGLSFFDPTVYELSPSNGGWTYTELYVVGGYGTVAPPTMDSAGNLYGTGAFSDPEVFRVTPSNGQWTLTGFNGSAGAGPYSNVIFDAGGNAYATASQGGTPGAGVVFEITP
jgi:uncharacterized repeat protein (TIGR03803 family)